MVGREDAHPVILVCGEALIDLAETATGQYTARPGGSPFNVAVACARLGVPVAYFGRLSSDHFGARLRSALAMEGVDLGYALSGAEPTPLAFVHLEPGQEPDYSFYVSGTADGQFLADDLPADLSPRVRAVHLGSLSLVLEPGASALEVLLRRESGRRLISLDPNVRPSLIPDRHDYERRLLSWLPHVHLLKASEADLGWLYPGEEPEAIARRWIAAGPDVVLVTLGRQGAIALSSSHTVFRAAPAIEVVDTVGAGDSFMAGVLAALSTRGALDQTALPELSEPQLAATVDYALQVAAITCKRPGADPPRSHELCHM